LLKPPWKKENGTETPGPNKEGPDFPRGGGDEQKKGTEKVINFIKRGKREFGEWIVEIKRGAVGCAWDNNMEVEKTGAPLFGDKGREVPDQ